MPRRQADQILKHDISVALTGMLRKTTVNIQMFFLV
jgi:hypothetical protein